MHRTLKVILLCLVTLGVWLPAGAQNADGPELLIVDKVFDFKDVEEGAVLKHDFIVKNMGNKPLVIRKVAPG